MDTLSVILLVSFDAVVDNAVSKTLRLPFDHATNALPRTATVVSINAVVTIVARPLLQETLNPVRFFLLNLVLSDILLNRAYLLLLD